MATDHRDPRIESPSEAIDPTSVSRSVVSAWAEQIRPLLLDPAIIAEPADSPPEAALAHGRDFQGAASPRGFQPRSRWTGTQRAEPVPAAMADELGDRESEPVHFRVEGKPLRFPARSMISARSRDRLITDFVSGAYRSGASVAADVWTQADLSRFTGMQGNRADVTARGSIPPRSSPGGGPRTRPRGRSP